MWSPLRQVCLSVDQNSNVAISICGVGYETKYCEVLRKSEHSNSYAGWNRILAISPILLMFRYLGLYEGNCVFTNSFYRKYDRRRKNARHLMCIGRDMISRYTELHGQMQSKFAIHSLFSFRNSLNIV